MRQRPARAGARQQQHRRLLGGDRGDARVPVGIIGAARDERLQALAHRIGEVAQALHVDDDDALQRGTAVAHQQHLVELFVVLDEQHAAARIAQRLAERFGFLLRMDAAAHAADAENAEVDMHPFRTRLGEHAGDVAGTEADRLQAHADLAHARAELRPGGRLPDAAILLAQHDVAAMRRDARGEDRGYACRVQCHSRFLFQRRWPRMPVSFWPR